MEKEAVRKDRHGLYRVENSPILLELVIYEHRRGRTPADIVESFPALTVEEVEQALEFCRANAEMVEEYLRTQQRDWEKVKANLDAKSSPLAERLQKRKAEQSETSHARSQP